jgi:hypothetical protein
MRKISKVTHATEEQQAADSERSDPRPRRIPGATITSWHNSPEEHLDAMVQMPAPGPSVAAATHGATSRTDINTVSLSDGTRITFPSSYQFGIVS